MTLIAMIEQVPSDNVGGSESQIQELAAEAQDYESAMTALREQLPEGWRIMNVRRETY